MERVLKEAMAGLEGLTDEQSGQWLRVAWFVLLLAIHRRDEEQLVGVVLEQARHSRFRERERITTMGMSVAEQWEALGEARATRAALRTVLTARFGALSAEIETAIASAVVETMNAWLRNASTAATLEEVGIIPMNSSAG
jgi:hypothetical protein